MEVRRSQAPPLLQRLCRTLQLARVIEVSDGDTLTVKVDRLYRDEGVRRIRLKGVSTRDGDTEADTFLHELLPPGTWVAVETFKLTYDRYEGYVTLQDGRDVGQLIVKAGYGTQA